MGQRIIVAGIGTDVGKTVVSAVLVKALQAEYWKPVQTGLERDAETVKALVPEAFCHPEAYHFPLPASPHQAAAEAGQEITTLEVPCHEKLLVIELAGGVMVPLRKDYLSLEWAQNIDAEWVIVSKYYLGSINHTLLTLAALAGQKIKGLVLVGDKNEASREVLISKAPLLMELPTALITPEQITTWSYELTAR